MRYMPLALIFSLCLCLCLVGCSKQNSPAADSFPSAKMVATAAGQNWFRVDLSDIPQDKHVGLIVGIDGSIEYQGGISGFAGKVTAVMIQFTEDGDIRWSIISKDGKSHGQGTVKGAGIFDGYSVSATRSIPTPARPGEALIAKGNDSVSLDPAPKAGLGLSIGTSDTANDLRQ